MFSSKTMFRQCAVVFLGMAILAAAAFILPRPLLAATASSGGPVTIKLPNFLGCSNAQCLLEQILHALWVLASLLTTIMILIGAFQMITAAGNPEKIETAKRTILYAVIGFAVVVLAWSADTIIKGVLQDITGSSPASNNGNLPTNTVKPPCDPTDPVCAGD